MKFQEHTCFWMDVATRKITRYYNRRLAEFGITYNHYFILTILWEKEGVNVKDLCRYLFLDSPSLTGHLDRMERAGLVVRKADLRDRRAIRVCLTEKGKELQEKLEPIGQELKDLLQKGVPKEVLRAFQEGLVHIHRRIG